MSARWRIGFGADECSTAMATASKSLSPAALAILHKGAAKELEKLVDRHLGRLATSRHDSARELGAKPTKAISTGLSSYAADATGATATIASPIFSRAFKDVAIHPKPPRRSLAIPIHAWAYGVSPRDWKARRSRRGELVELKIMGKSTGLLAAKTAKKGKLTPMYVLVASLVQKQDRSLLPSDRELGEAARDGVMDVIVRAMARARGRTAS